MWITVPLARALMILLKKKSMILSLSVTKEDSMKEKAQLTFLALSDMILQKMTEDLSF